MDATGITDGRTWANSLRATAVGTRQVSCFKWLQACTCGLRAGLCKKGPCTKSICWLQAHSWMLNSIRTRGSTRREHICRYDHAPMQLSLPFHFLCECLPCPGAAGNTVEALWTQLRQPKKQIRQQDATVRCQPQQPIMIQYCTSINQSCQSILCHVHVATPTHL